VLHDACEYGAPFEVFKMLLTRYPDAVRFKDTLNGEIPLHIACEYGGASTEGVETLINSYPKSLVEATGQGETPLNLACTGGASSDIIQLLLNRGPQAVKMKDNERNLPLHSTHKLDPSNAQSLPKSHVSVQ
jgi:ankyrin repeat protein